jgi:tetratricopeptide (TPR) repeat protein
MNGVSVIKSGSEIDKNSEVIDWDEDVFISAEDSYQAMRRALQRTQGFSLFFVRCSPVEGNKLIRKLEKDLQHKKIKTLMLEDETENFYNLVAALPEKKDINILFIRGLEHSLLRYEEKESLGLNLPSESKVYGGTWAGIPRILGHLNLSRERFRDSFSIAFVFLLPEFALRYFIRRAPDFFDWRSGVYDFPTEQESVNSEAYRLVFIEGGDFKKYQTWTDQQRLQRLTEIRAYLSESSDSARTSELWFEKSLIHHANNQLEEAITSYDQALKIKPDYHTAWYNRGIALENLGRNEEAIASYDEALKIKSDFHEVWYNRGSALANLSRYEEAITSFDNALKFKPDKHQAWNNRGTALLNLGRYEEAITSFDNALKFKPDMHEVWNNRGIALGNLGKYEEEITSYDYALKIKPDLHEALNNRWVALKQLEDRLKYAITSYDQALKIKPDDHEAWNNRGIALRNLGRLEEAITSYDNALKFKPDLHEAWYNRGFVLLNLGRLEEAITSYDNALKFKPDDANTYYNKSCAYALQENIDLAIANLQQAINLDSKYLEMAKTDTDFDKIRNDSRFINLLNIEH